MHRAHCPSNLFIQRMEFFVASPDLPLLAVVVDGHAVPGKLSAIFCIGLSVDHPQCDGTENAG